MLLLVYFSHTKSSHTHTQNIVEWRSRAGREAIKSSSTAPKEKKYLGWEREEEKVNGKQVFVGILEQHLVSACLALPASFFLQHGISGSLEERARAWHELPAFHQNYTCSFAFTFTRTLVCMCCVCDLKGYIALNRRKRSKKSSIILAEFLHSSIQL